MHNRVLMGIISGALLGVICIIGATLRSAETLSTGYLIAFWYNRVLIGLVVGLISRNTLKLRIIHGVIFGTLVSFAFYSSTNYADVVGFIAGIIYGVIISVVIYYFDKKDTNKSESE